MLMIKSLLTVLFLINCFNVSFSQQINIPIIVTDGFNTDTLRYGLDPSATDGIDSPLGESELPPVPPTGIFDARFVGTGIGIPIGEGLKKDFRTGSNSTSGTRIHRIQYKTGSGTSIRLIWENMPPGVTVRIQDIIVGFLIDTTFSGSGSYLIANPLGFSALNFTVNYTLSQPTSLNLKLAIEGFYNTAIDNHNINDTVRVFLRTILSPYSIIDSSKSVIDSISLTGTFVFPNIATGIYYIAVKHRNGLETWSKSGGENFIQGSEVNYDFTTSASQAYGSNQKLKGSKYCVFSGDSNQDGSINITDKNLIVNKLGMPGYLREDLDGNRFINAKDRAINVLNLGKTKVTP